jgi:predicted Zn-dependent protease
LKSQLFGYGLIMHIALLALFLLPVIIRLGMAILEPDRLKMQEGRKAYNFIEAQFGGLSKDPMVTRIGTQLAQTAKIDATFHVVSSPLINAVSLPDGRILIWRGLLDRLRSSPDQLAAVLAHEIGHLKYEHYLRSVYLMSIVQFALGFLVRPLIGALSRHAIRVVIDKGYSRFRERQADDAAVEILTAAGIAPSAMISLFENLSSITPNMGLLGSHPSPVSRADRIRRQLSRENENKEEIGESAKSSMYTDNVLPFKRR